ncbi:hypothetical protein [Nonomuraea endophytica]|uniref:Peptidase inhibitor family I36 protein n=1 Tax=Nonomuraea endophytica TaxID=714136 RepID=A0A7W8A5S2_9ACTN|nr:hypothetical protein [Nonomuraea endophytica]MBB5078783.1 hypothetical protein [Nonomuraea endophytica]
MKRVAIAGLMVAAGLVSSSSPATADAGGPKYGCAVGDICFYEDSGLTKKISTGQTGNWSGSGTYSATRAVFNNGTMGGFDHVNLTIRYTWENQVMEDTICVHVAEPRKAWLGIARFDFPLDPIRVQWVPADTVGCDV